MRVFKEQAMKSAQSPSWQTLTTSGSASYQPTIVNNNAQVMNYSAASLTSRA